MTGTNREETTPLPPWIFATKNSGRVRGAFDMRRWVSWHDDSLPAEVAFGTAAHEELHATALAGSALHLYMVQDVLSDGGLMVGGVPEPRYADYLQFHEGVPKAWDELTGSHVSSYVAPDIIAMGFRLAELSRLVAEAGRGAGDAGAIVDLELVALRGIALAISDGCETPDWPTTAALVDGLLEVCRLEPSRAWPSGQFERSRPGTHQIRSHIGSLLSAEFGQPVTRIPDTWVVAQTFVNLITILLGEERGAGRLSSLFFPLLNLIFPGASTPHLVLRPDIRQLSITTVEVAISRMVTGDDAGEAARSARIDQLTASHKAALYHDELDYLYQGFLVKQVFDAPYVHRGLTRAYMNRMWAAFPTAFIGICDAVLDPAGYTIDHDERTDLLRVLKEHSEVIEPVLGDYRKLRDHLWSELLLVVPRLPYWLAGESELLFRSFLARGLIDFDPQEGPLDVFMGTSPLARFMPD